MTPPSFMTVRIDKWLWAARFFKTRALAAQAVTGGRVHLNGARVKPGHTLKIGDQLKIGKESIEWIVDVTGVSEQRGPAREAILLYQETAQSQKKRQEESEKKRQIVAILGTAPIPGGPRPTKRERRRLCLQSQDLGGLHPPIPLLFEGSKTEVKSKSKTLGAIPQTPFFF
ncbi:MAG: S4 domain-containing protein [Magnetococcus sp. DMHC-6]